MPSFNLANSLKDTQSPQSDVGDFLQPASSPRDSAQLNTTSTSQEGHSPIGSSNQGTTDQ